MKRIKLVIIASILNICAFVPHSEGQWILQNSGVDKALRSVHSISNNRCWVVGDSGIILRTTNGGNNWIKISLGANIVLNSVRFANANYGWAVGDSGRIYRTINGGYRWREQISGTTCDLQSVFFINAFTGWAVGDSSVILKTTNRGVNWVFQSSDLLKLFYSVFFIDANTGWITGYATLKTTDSGANWAAKVASTNRRSIFFTDANTGWVVGGSYTLNKSTDGGETWGAAFQKKDESDSPPATFTSICFKDMNTGWYTVAHSSGGRITITTNNGVNWTVDYPTTRNRQLFEVFVLSSGIGWAVGNNGTILKRSNLTGISNESGVTPSAYSLSQNYPNPFNPETKIQFTVPQIKFPSSEGWQTKSDGVGLVRLTVYDALGREIETLVNEALQPGTYEVTFNGSRYNSGVYFYRLTTDEYSETKRMVLIK